MKTNVKILGVALSLCALSITSPSHAAAGVKRPQTSRQPVDFSGTWERWPSITYPTPGPHKFGTPPQPPPPLKPEYLGAWTAEQARLKAAADKGEPIATGYEKCLPDGMPTMMNGMFPMEVLQSRGQVTFIQEAYNQVRRVYLGEPQSTPDQVDPTFYGHSVGHWEGDALVIDTIGVKDYVRLRGVPHSPDMRIKERLHLVAPDILHNEVVIEDPAVLTSPWRYTVAYKRMAHYKMLEYICEDNREYVDANGVTRLRIEPEAKTK
jgi:hypothetical protein